MLNSRKIFFSFTLIFYYMRPAQTLCHACREALDRSVAPHLIDDNSMKKCERYFVYAFCGNAQAKLVIPKKYVKN